MESSFKFFNFKCYYKYSRSYVLDYSAVFFGSSFIFGNFQTPSALSLITNISEIEVTVR